MISAPGPSMLDEKLFVGRFDNPFPDLYERWWDGVEWIWVDHGRPSGEKIVQPPGAAMSNSKLFVVTETGKVWERHWRSDLGRWAWEDHGRPGNQKVIAAPGAAMLNEKFFVTTKPGNVWERHWRSDLGRWAWEDHGRPGNQKVIAAPGAAMLNEKFFVTTETGNVWERHWRSDLGRWAWEDHGRPGNQKVIAAPGAAMLNEKFFVTTKPGNVWERHWRSDLGRWAWEDHGRPGNQKVIAAPGAAMLNEKFFVTTDNGNVWERHFRSDLGRWAWEDHGRPTDTRAATEPGAAMMDSKFFVGAQNSHLFERVWTGEEWKWVDHGTAFHDTSQHVIGSPDTEPAIVIAIMGDGFDESSMDEYRRIVDDQVAAAFRLDQFGDHADRLQVIRIDVASPVTGVWEQTWDEAGTIATTADDTVLSETFRPSRLGMISTEVWARCWIVPSTFTTPRIDSIRNRFAPAATNTVVVVNSGKFGGCNRGAMAAFTKTSSRFVIAHEMGHNLFGLGDEYHNGTAAFTGTTGQPNLSEMPATWTALKWHDLVEAATPLPTDAGAPPAGWNNRTSVGAFEGGGGNFATGIFRPVLECRMNQNDPPWCPVCAREIDRVFGAL
ncbi:M64 family metallopeptidase [Microbacterium sp. B2969]|uniref:M64 family metallopeptidase n=1 Tax=Microbacterium alkaliflavum TaxID=3248839 RepID=A0ABW7Q3L6_9MICO